MKTYWELTETGIRRPAAEPFTDTVEMAGHQLAAIVTYGVTEAGTLQVSRELCYPRLRTLPRDTFGTLHAFHPDEQRQVLFIDGQPAGEYPAEFLFDGVLQIVSTDRDRRVRITRSCFPSVEQFAYIEQIVVENISGKPLTVTVGAVQNTAYVRGAAGVYAVEAAAEEIRKTLTAGESVSSTLCFTARVHCHPAIAVDGDAELVARRALVAQLCDGSLRLSCDDPELVQFFRFAKLRAAESIYDTVAGPLHSPGGGPYYAAVWANDQAEYAGPFFPYMGYDRADDASLNAYDLFANFMSPEGTPIPSSVIDEGRDFWEGAGDRGDAAMYLYGCTRYLLALGDRDLAASRFWTIRWAADFCLSRRTPDGVIASDSDELEERLPSGDANLCTSCLTYGGLLSAAALATELGYPELAAQWQSAAEDLHKAINTYFGATVSGYDTYRYYDGNDVLRSWICMPLTVGIRERQNGTADALLSDRLFRDDGVLSVEGDVTFWDRSTLYTFRGILNAGESDRVYPFMQRYITQRLRGTHVPYAVEAYPEGNQRHLSAESALFARVVTEGLCGITPTGLRQAAICPAVPAALGTVTLAGICMGGTTFDLEIVRTDDGHTITATLADGRTHHVHLPFGETFILEL